MLDSADSDILWHTDTLWHTHTHSHTRLQFPLSKNQAFLTSRSDWIFFYLNDWAMFLNQNTNYSYRNKDFKKPQSCSVSALSNSLMNILKGQGSLVQLCGCLCVHCLWQMLLSCLTLRKYFHPAISPVVFALPFKAAGWLCERFSLPSCLSHHSVMTVPCLLRMSLLLVGSFFSQPCSFNR